MFFRSSTRFSVTIRRLAKASAVWLYSAALAVSPRLAASLAIDRAWRVEPADPLQLLHGPVELQLGLLLVGDYAGRLLDEAPVLLLGLGHGLLELDLRVGALLPPAGKLGGQVLPSATYDFPHASHATTGKGEGLDRPGRRRPRGKPVGNGRLNGRRARWPPGASPWPRPAPR